MPQFWTIVHDHGYMCFSIMLFKIFSPSKKRGNVVFTCDLNSYVSIRLAFSSFQGRRGLSWIADVQNFGYEVTSFA